MSRWNNAFCKSRRPSITASTFIESALMRIDHAIRGYDELPVVGNTLIREALEQLCRAEDSAETGNLSQNGSGLFFWRQQGGLAG